jgi:hypothetical protein
MEKSNFELSEASKNSIVAIAEGAAVTGVLEAVAKLSDLPLDWKINAAAGALASVATFKHWEAKRLAN